MDFQNLKAFMDDMAKNHTVGNDCEVYLDGKSVFRYFSGCSDWENKTPLNENELYNIYSCSKVATVTAGLQLYERGKFLLSDPLCEYMPEFRTMYIKNSDGEVSEAKNPITVRDVFTMSAGFSYDFESGWVERAREKTNGNFDTVTSIREFAKEPILFEPGTHWSYSLGHDVLAAFVSVVSGKKFRDYMKENIFDPIGMKDTHYHATPEIEKRIAEQYTFVPDDGNTVTDIVEAQKNGNAKKGTFKNVGKPVSHVLGPEYDSGGAGIITSVSDYAKFCAALANYGTATNGEKILSKSTVELLRTNQLDSTQIKDFNWQQLIGYGYGLGVRTHMNPAVSGCISNIGEFGWGGAAGATVVCDPKNNLAVFYAQHVLNPREEYYQPRLKNVVYSDLG